MSNPAQVSVIPPPPPALKPFTGKYSQRRTATTLAKRCDIDECTWADEWPELQKACYLAKVCTYAPPKSCRYKNISSILQEGPTCGLTALSMILNGTPAPVELLSTAKQRNYTNNGEMFSAKNLHQLICDTIAERRDDDVTPIECQLFEGRLNCAKVRDCLLNEACIFVAVRFIFQANFDRQSFSRLLVRWLRCLANFCLSHCIRKSKKKLIRFEWLTCLVHD